MLRPAKSVLILLIFAFIEDSCQDVSHLLYARPEQFSYFQQHQHSYPISYPILTQPPVSFQTSLYATSAPPNHDGPIDVSQIATPAPVAPIGTSTELVLPEIVENRNAKNQKDHRYFIPLQKQYLPPPPPANDERPIYESPQQGDQQYIPFNNGYIYHKPSISTTTSTTTTTPRPQTVTTADSPELRPPINNDPLPPINNDPIAPESEPSQGYDYYRPSTPIIVAADTPFNQHFPTPAPEYLPLSKDQLSIEENNDIAVPQLRIRINEMRCLQQQTKAKGYFRTVFKIDNYLSATPSVDNDSSDKRCEVKVQRGYVVVDIAGEDFEQCGVLQCGMDLCLRLRFPAIRGMRTGSDGILTLHCKTQSKIAFKTHALKIGVTNDVQSRSIGTYAKGGAQNPLRTQIELLRKTSNGYNKYVQANEAVQLGQDLLLRAHVLTGDGWNYTKLTDVRLQRISPSGEILNNVQLINSQGCLNPSMKGICTQSPSFDAPLGYKLPFKAVMFKGMKSGDDMILSMRITGCLEHQDCFINEDQCNNPNTAGLIRRKRDMQKDSMHNKTEMSEISKISFKVIMPNEESVEKSFISNSFRNQTKSTILFSSFCFIVFLIFLGIFILIKFRKY